MTIDPLRHLKIFSPEEFGNRRIDVIGAGATGSAVVYELAKLGVKNIHVWDFDTVEQHNIANQMYGNPDIGRYKVEALAALIRFQTGMEIIPHVEKVTADTRGLGEIVFLLTDTMASRKEISDGAILFNAVTTKLIETRMSAEMGLIYTINPNSPSQVKAWQRTLYDDAEAEESVCGATTTVGATAKIISSLAVWNMLKAVKNEEVPNEITVAVSPFLIQTRNFS